MIKEFNLGGVTWSVKIDNSRLEDLCLLGMCENPKALISLCDDGINAEIIEQTLYHEVVHAILDSMGEKELSADDKFTQRFAMLLHQFETSKR